MEYDPIFTKTPSSFGQRWFMAIIALIATGLALYLGLYQWRMIPSAYDPLFQDGTMRVLDSDVSHTITRWIRIPDAMLGVLAYLSDAIFAMAGSDQRWRDRPWLVMIFGIDVIPLGIVSIVLVILQGTVVGHWCTFCLATAIVSLLLILFSYNEVWTSIVYLYHLWQQTRSRREVWNAFWGSPSDAALKAAVKTLKELPRHAPRMQPSFRWIDHWPRILEIMIGIWLIFQATWFEASLPKTSYLGILVIALAAGSFLKPFRRLHTLQCLIAYILLWRSYTAPVTPLPIVVQTDILVALLLGMIALLPAPIS
ncbi:MAG: hypothetical protein RL235_1, partial [Chlamydiota bacterium]